MAVLVPLSWSVPVASVSPAYRKTDTRWQRRPDFNSRVRLFVQFAVIAAALVGCPVAAWAADDPCGGTGGNGTVVRSGKASFTMTANDGAKHVVHVARP